jgi:hypothetical protein
MKLSVITCVKNDTADLLLSLSSIYPFLNIDFFWFIKFSQDCSDVFINSIPENPYVVKIKTPDRSLYDGINQALVHCRSEYYFVLGAGDLLSPTNFPKAICEFNENDGLSAFFFSCFMQENSQTFKPHPENINTIMSCPHPGSILKTRNSLDLNGYSEKYDIAADYDHLCKYLIKHTDFYRSETILSEFMGGGISSLRRFEGVLEEELIRMRIHKSNEFAVYARLLEKITYPLSNLIRNNFQ